MKNQIIILFIIFFPILFSCQMPEEEDPVISIGFEETEIDLCIGQIYFLNGHPVVPNDAVFDFSWSTSDDSVVIITDPENYYASGIIEAVGTGQCVISVTSADGKSSDSCIVNVTEANPFIFTCRTYNDDESDNEINIGTSLDFDGQLTIVWGDGEKDYIHSDFSYQTHSYSEPGVYEIQILGEVIPSVHPYSENDRLLEIKNWGNYQFSQYLYTYNDGVEEIDCKEFRGRSYMTITATDSPDISKVSSFSNLFYGCSSLASVPSINEWDTSHITDMSYMFWGCTNFNQNLSGLETGNVTDMSSMFSYCSSFNQNLASWDTSSVQDMTSMFYSASIFNQSLASWDISNVLYMRNLFFQLDNNLSTENLEATLISWAVQDVQSDVVCDLQGVCSSSAANDAVNHLRNDHGWDFVLGYSP